MVSVARRVYCSSPGFTWIDTDVGRVTVDCAERLDLISLVNNIERVMDNTKERYKIFGKIVWIIVILLNDKWKSVT